MNFVKYRPRSGVVVALQAEKQSGLMIDLASTGDRRYGFSPWVGKILWRKAWQPTPVFSPGRLVQRSLAGSSPWDHKESDMTEVT